MATLTKTQLEHAKTRISEAKRAYIQSRLALFGEEPDVRCFTHDEKVAMIRNAVATLKPGDHGRHCNVTDEFTYPATPEMVEQQEALECWKIHSKGITASANALEQTLLDELIMSPDGAAALLRISATFA